MNIDNGAYEEKGFQKNGCRHHENQVCYNTWLPIEQKPYMLSDENLMQEKASQ